MNWTSLRLAAMLAVALSFDSRPARALDQLHLFTFSQTGYSEDAKVTGAFAGFDLDGNGILVHFPGQEAAPINVNELSAFSMHFSGNSLAPAFDLSLDDLFGFVYQLGTNGIGDDPATDPDFGDIVEGIGAIGANYFYTSGLGPNFVIGGYVGGELEFEDLINVEDHALDSSPNLLLVAPVPEPSTVALLAAAALATLGRRRKALAS
jgi:PEP-CTERM motif-containing protein